MGFALKAQRKVVATGSEGLIGETGVVYKTLNPKGLIQVHGEFWRAESSSTLKKGTQVKVIEYDGQNLNLIVEKI